MSIGPIEPAARARTHRDALTAVLRAGWATVAELSAAVGLSEAEIPGHLEHVRRTVTRAGERFEVQPPDCLACGFVFRDRSKLRKPSRCPSCRSERIRPARFRLLP